MNYCNALSKAVTSAIQDMRIGKPVFFRWTALLAKSTDDIKRFAAFLAQEASSWIDSEPGRCYAVGRLEDGLISVFLAYPDGRSGVICSGPARGRPQVDLIVLGTEGSLQHREQPGDELDVPLAPEKEPGLTHYLELISAALAADDHVDASSNQAQTRNP